MKKQFKFHPNDTKIDKKMVEITENTGFKIAVFSMGGMTILGSSAIASALPAINRHFHELLLHTAPQSFAFSHLDILTRLVLTIPAIFVMLVSPFAGMLMDKFGKLKFVLPAMIFWTFSGVSGFFLNDIYLILLSRSIFGVATAFIMTGASALLGDYYSRGGFNRREKALSWQGFYSAIVGAVFISIAGFVSSYSWRYPFLVYGLGIIIAVIAVVYLFEPHKFKNHTKSKNSTNINYHYRHFFPTYFIGFFIMVVYYISPTQLPYYIEENLGLDPKYIGVSMSVSALFYGFFSLSYKHIISFLTAKMIYLITLFLMGCSFLLLHFVHSYSAVLIALALLGMSGGVMLVNNTSYLFSICPENIRAKTYGILVSCAFLGQFTSPIISQPLVRQIGLVNAFLAWSIVIFAVFFLFIFFKEKSKIA